MERVFKNIMGYQKETKTKKATHVALTIEEYDELQEEIRNANNEKEKSIKELTGKIRQYVAQSDKQMFEIKEKAEKRVNTLQNELNISSNEITRLEDLNANLKRICKERANSKRNLIPKKEHHGYMVLDSQQYTYNFHLGDKKTVYTVPCWKVRIQSFYDSSIPYETVVNELSNDLMNTYGSTLNIQSLYPNGSLERKSATELKKLWENDKNFIFKTSYRSNMKTGFWEVEYLIKSYYVNTVK